ncbi:MAG: hypothetical protein ACYDEJ_16200 [Desulfitobacteriaceae bacterium]
MNNISCSVEGCNEPVIGQCQGYHESCGRFYCKRHSVGKLCDECFAETEKDRIYSEYVSACKYVKSAWKKALGRFLIFYIICGLCFIPIVSITETQQENIALALILGIFSIVVLILLVYIPVKVFKTEKKERMSEMKPKYTDIEEFYRVWSTQGNRAALCAIGLITAAVIVGSMESPIEKDVRRIRNRLE